MELVREGEINSIDVANGKARVIYKDRDNKVSNWLNILVPFSDSHSDNYNLVIGQSVLVLSLPDMPEEGYILGCPMRSSSITEGEVKRTYSDGNSISYKNGILVFNIPKIEITGDLTINGTTITGGSINLNTHTHSGITTGGDKTRGPE